MAVLATYNVKGGVGKTATVVNLAHRAAVTGQGNGARTLIFDLDPQGAASYYFRAAPKVRQRGTSLVRGKVDVREAITPTDFDGLDLIPSDFSFRNLDVVLDAAKDPGKSLARVVRPLARRYEHVFLDCPPSISLVSESVFEATDALLVPLIPATLSSRTLDQLAAVVASEADNPPQLLAFFSMVDGRKRLHKEVMEQLAMRHEWVLRTAIPAASDIERMGLERTVVPEYAPRSRAARAYEDLWSEVGERLARD